MKLKRRKPERSGIRDEETRREYRRHQKYVRGYPCACADHGGCWGKIVFAHVRAGTDGGTGLKPADWWGLALCWGHHHEQHEKGEAWFEDWYGIDMKKIATELARRSPIQEVREKAGVKL